MQSRSAKRHAQNRKKKKKKENGTPHGKVEKL